MKKERLIMSPFNATFNISFAAFIVLLAGGSFLLRNASDAVRQNVLVAVCILTFICFFVYKHYLSRDSEYRVINAAMGGFNWWNELPLHLCNINMILIPLAVILRRDELMCFCFFVAPLGALMALVMPTNGFGGYSLLLPRILGFYGNHFMIFIQGLAIVTFGFYVPKFADIPGALVVFAILGIIVHCINAGFRLSRLSPKANYFYTMETEGNAVLNTFRRWIPVPLLYLLPCLLVSGIYMAIITALFSLFAGRR